MAKKLDKSGRLKRLLEAGYLPDELPPPFVSGTFSTYRESLHRKWQTVPQQKYQHYKSSPDVLSIPKYGHERRKIAIVNPINQMRLSRVIADNWIDIRDFINTSKISEYRAIFDLNGRRAIFGVDWDAVSSRRNTISAQYSGQFHTDISKFYPTIYTHSIAWAYFGKQLVQANLNANWLKQSYLNSLDIEIRHGQRNQSVGLPIGPDTSRIVAEIVARGIEKAVEVRIPDLGDRALRYVDDFTVGVNDGEAEEHTVIAVELAFAEFELGMNFAKTKFINHKVALPELWKEHLSTVPLINRPERQRDKLENYFDIAFRAAEKSEKDAVLKWAVKRARSFKIDPKNQKYFYEKILHVGRRAPACMGAISQLLIDARHNSQTLPIDSIRKYISDNIKVAGKTGHAYEVMWALFLCKGLSITVNRSEVEHLFSMSSSSVALILMDLDRRGLIDGGIDDTIWMQDCANANGLQSPMWLLAYEAVRKGWWSVPTTYVQADPFFDPMLLKGIHFYDENKNVPPTRRERRESAWLSLIRQRILSQWQDYA
ncbi:MAG: RNA-directed DNA polymerase [Alphaproteobacteria bacterium]|nr:RNA-directed DNA polymerase [Alphaproteobacteria bacterium]MBU2380459.1 RNA-directed DNA polymerase [Alphaproteobacteria bacterium]